MAKLTQADCMKYLKVAVEVTRNYGQAAGHGPMIENIYRTMCKLHEQMPDDSQEESSPAPPPQAATP